MQRLTSALMLILLSGGLLVWVWKKNIADKRWLVFAVSLFMTADLGVFFVSNLAEFDPRITRYSKDFLNFFPKKPEPPRVYDGTVLPNVSMPAHLSFLCGNTGNVLLRFNRFLTKAQGLPESVSMGNIFLRRTDPVFRMLGFDYRVVSGKEIFQGTPVLARNTEGYCLTAHPWASPRAFLATAPRACKTPDEAFDYIFDEKADLLNAPAVENGDTPLPTANPLVPGERVDFKSYSINRVELAVDAAQPRLLVLDEMYYKDWVVRINGVVAPILPSNYIFRGVLVPPGKSTVVFSYESAAFKRGLCISGISIFAVGTCFLLFWRKQKRNK